MTTAAILIVSMITTQLAAAHANTNMDTIIRVIQSLNAMTLAGCIYLIISDIREGKDE